eukprot:jgi/Chlat1/5138/Chrsp33S05131
MAVAASIASDVEDNAPGTSGQESPSQQQHAAQQQEKPAAGLALTHSERAWAHFRKLGSPKHHVAPMVDQSELPFRMLCRRYGADAAYTPMLHSRLFKEGAAYRDEHFTTCAEDRPLWVQFCANDPDVLLEAARYVEPHCDYIDINLGCPQRIAKRGRYGAFLMDDIPLICRMVNKLATNLSTPVSVKIRRFRDIEETVRYAKQLEEAGASLIAVHGRTREEKSGALRANLEVIRRVKEAVSVPVLGNGNIRHLEDAHEHMRITGVDGVLSAESLLENPALFSGRLLAGEGELCADPIELCLEYLELCRTYPTAMRMVRGHVHKMLGCWFSVHPDVRQNLNNNWKLTIDWLVDMCKELQRRNAANPTLQPVLNSSGSSDAASQQSEPATSDRLLQLRQLKKAKVEGDGATTVALEAATC